VTEKHRRRRWLVLAAALTVAALIALPFAWRAIVHGAYAGRIYTPDSVPPRRVAIVFGAAIYRNGALSAMLEDRVETAVRLYEDGKVERLLFSGDNRYVEYNEPGRMADYAIARGVPPEAIQPDYGGRSTYDTCYRARDIFGVEKAILVTQGFHLPRALFTCDRLGLDVVAVGADLQSYGERSLRWSENREIPALLGALVDVLRGRPAEVLGEPIPFD
jgi:SanA protein